MTFVTLGNFCDLDSATYNDKRYFRTNRFEAARRKPLLFCFPSSLNISPAKSISRAGLKAELQTCTVAALHQGAPGQMTWLEDPPPWLPPWRRPAYCFALLR